MWSNHQCYSELCIDLEIIMIPALCPIPYTLIYIAHLCMPIPSCVIYLFFFIVVPCIVVAFDRYLVPIAVPPL